MNKQKTLDQLMSDIMFLDEGVLDRWGAIGAGVRANLEPSESGVPKLEKTRNAAFIHLINNFLDRLAKYQTAFRDLAFDNWASMPDKTRDGMTIEDFRLNKYMSGLRKIEAYASNQTLGKSREASDTAEPFKNVYEETPEKQERYRDTIAAWATAHPELTAAPEPKMPVSSDPTAEKAPDTPYTYEQLDRAIEKKLSDMDPNKKLPDYMTRERIELAYDKMSCVIKLTYQGNKVRNKRQQDDVLQYYHKLQEVVSGDNVDVNITSGTINKDYIFAVTINSDDPEQANLRQPYVCTKTFGDQVVNVAERLKMAIEQANQFVNLPQKDTDERRVKSVLSEDLAQNVSKIFSSAKLPVGLVFKGIEKNTITDFRLLTFEYQKPRKTYSETLLHKFINAVVAQSESTINSVSETDTGILSTAMSETRKYDNVTSRPIMESFKSYSSTVCLTEGIIEHVKTDTAKDGDSNTIRLKIKPKYARAEYNFPASNISTEYADRIIRSAKALAKHMSNPAYEEILHPPVSQIVDDGDDADTTKSKIYQALVNVDAHKKTSKLTDGFRFFEILKQGSDTTKFEPIKLSGKSVSMLLYLEKAGVSDETLASLAKNKLTTLKSVVNNITEDNVKMFRQTPPVVKLYLAGKKSRETGGGTIIHYVPYIISIATNPSPVGANVLTKDAARKLNALVNGLLMGLPA